MSQKQLNKTRDELDDNDWVWDYTQMTGVIWNI